MSSSTQAEHPQKLKHGFAAWTSPTEENVHTGVLGALSGPVGRLIFALPFFMFGVIHFFAGSQMAGLVPIPGGVFWVYFTGIALVAASVAFGSGRWVPLASIGLALMLGIFILTIHIPGLFGGQMQASLTNLLKDTALAGGALMAMRAVGRHRR